MIEVVEDKCESLIKHLDEIQNNFSEQRLRGVLDDTEEHFEKLKIIRKKLTQFHIASYKTIKAAQLQTTAKKHNICQMKNT